jgi:hypothetical protein
MPLAPANISLAAEKVLSNSQGLKPLKNRGHLCRG